jgi:hypothetical protein
MHNRLLPLLMGAQGEGDDAILCKALDFLAEGTGQNKYRFAASILRGIKLGRHAINDREALRRIAAFPAARKRAAVGIVARQIAAVEGGHTRIDSIAQRLRRKLRKKKTGGIVDAARAGTGNVAGRA